MMKTNTDGIGSVPPHCDLKFDKAVSLWDEAIPLGSGLTGCLIYGDGAPLKLSLDRGDLWDCRPAEETLAEDYTYAELIRLVKEKKKDELERRFDVFYNKATPTKIPAGKLQLNYASHQSVKSGLSLQRAEAFVTVETEKGTSEISAFLSAETHFGHLKVSGVLPEAELLPHDFTPAERDSGYSLTHSSTKRMGYPESTPISCGAVRGFRQEIYDGAFALLYAEKSTADGKEAVFYVASSRDGEGWLESGIAAVSAALDSGYDRQLRSHLAWWETFWRKSAVRLPDRVLERHWYLANYFLGSCSRKGCPPMPLQGVWTADNGCLPPWKGDYHGNLNLQFSYYSAIKADHLEECESFLDFFTQRNRTAGRKFAQTFFDTPDGACMPSVFAFDGTSLGGWPMYATNIVNQIWELHVYYQYYKYTGNEEFLRSDLLPQLSECEKVVRRWLTEDEDGNLMLPLSSSPEIHDNELESWLPSVSNNDLALLRFLYTALIEFTDGEEYKRILSRLPDLMTDETGYVICKGYHPEESHRHHSHMMGAFPLDLVDWSDAQDRETVRRSLSHLRRLGTDWWVGFSFAWMADLEARMGDGDSAARNLRLLSERLCSPNGFHLNGDLHRSGLTKYDSPKYRPFTLESNMMAAEALQEMLLQCYDGVIRVFPAIPCEWKENGCRFAGLLAHGNVKVSAEMKDGAVRYVTLTARKSGTVKLLNPFRGTVETRSLSAGETVTVTE